MSLATEKHYSPEALAEKWDMHPSTIRRIFRDVDGVLRIGSRKRVMQRIPESIAARVHDERSRGFLTELKSSRGRV